MRRHFTCWNGASSPPSDSPTTRSHACYQLWIARPGFAGATDTISMERRSAWRRIARSSMACSARTDILFPRRAIGRGVAADSSEPTPNRSGARLLLQAERCRYWRLPPFFHRCTQSGGKLNLKLRSEMAFLARTFRAKTGATGDGYFLAAAKEADDDTLPPDALKAAEGIRPASAPPRRWFGDPTRRRTVVGGTRDTKATPSDRAVGLIRRAEGVPRLLGSGVRSQPRTPLDHGRVDESPLHFSRSCSRPGSNEQARTTRLKLQGKKVCGLRPGPGPSRSRSSSGRCWSS